MEVKAETQAASNMTSQSRAVCSAALTLTRQGPLLRDGTVQGPGRPINPLQDVPTDQLDPDNSSTESLFSDDCRLWALILKTNHHKCTKTDKTTPTAVYSMKFKFDTMQQMQG